MSRRLLVLALLTLGLSSPTAAAQTAPDCDGPPGDPPPGSAAWHQREQDNDYCGEQRPEDTSSNPAFATPSFQDPYRDPAELNGIRFRYQEISFTNKAGQRLDGALFRPPPRDQPP